MKRFSVVLSLILIFLLIFCITACTNDTESGDDTSADAEVSQNADESSDSDDSEITTEEQETTFDETTVEETTEEETTVIVDVPIGETLDAPYASDFTVSGAFSSDMVVQRGEFIRVWGFAKDSENGKKVSGEFMGMFAEALINDGEWCLTFGARQPACKELGNNMRIYTDKKEVVFTDVLVGDVYMVIGQSNVEYTVQTHISYSDEGGGLGAIDENSIIRLNCTNNASSNKPHPARGTIIVCPDVLNNKAWTRTTKQDTVGFSAIGYYFARHMIEKNNQSVPIGIIEMGFSGAPLGSYMPNQLADELGTDVYNAAKGYYTTTGVNSDGPSGRYIYNQYIYPFEKYAIAGIVWYQGCSDYATSNANVFAQNLSALMTYMRGTHNLINKNFPVLIAEFPSIYRMPEGSTEAWSYMDLGLIRAVAGSIPQYLKNSYVCAASDVWGDKTFPNSLHPNCKYKQSERMADIAVALSDGIGSLEQATGPILASYEFSEDRKTVVLDFTNTGDGLKTTDGKAVRGFVAYGRNLAQKNNVNLTAEITGKNQITVTSDKAIDAIGYNAESENFFGKEINLCGSTGSVACAFMARNDTTNTQVVTYDQIKKARNSAYKYKAFFFDVIKLDGETYEENGIQLFGDVIGNLKKIDNTVKVSTANTKLYLFGWYGFGYESVACGYSIDEGNAILDFAPLLPEDGVIAAGGKNAARYGYDVILNGLEKGEHTVHMLVQLDDGKDSVVELASFKILVE